MIIFFRIYLGIFGFGPLVKVLKRKRSNLLDIKKLNYVLKSIKLICSIIPNISCMIRASVVKRIFSETKNLEIIIGIHKDGNKSFESHAWAKFNNKIILNDDLKIDSYKVIYKI